jgi:hypothetical protein
MELASCHLSGASNFEVVPIFFKYLFTTGVRECCRLDTIPIVLDEYFRPTMAVVRIAIICKQLYSIPTKIKSVLNTAVLFKKPLQHFCLVTTCFCFVRPFFKSFT